MDDLSPEMAAFQAEFQEGFTQEAGFFYPYRLTPTPGVPFWGNVWAADVRGRTYAHFVSVYPQLLTEQDVRFLTVKPGDPEPAIRAEIPFQDGLLTLHGWGQTDALSGERIGACTWRP